jgi:hypothetical protein
LRAFVSSGQMIYREPVAHEIPLIAQPTAIAQMRRQRSSGSEQAAHTLFNFRTIASSDFSDCTL